MPPDTPLARPPSEPQIKKLDLPIGFYFVVNPDTSKVYDHIENSDIGLWLIGAHDIKISNGGNLTLLLASEFAADNPRRKAVIWESKGYGDAQFSKDVEAELKKLGFKEVIQVGTADSGVNLRGYFIDANYR